MLLLCVILCLTCLSHTQIYLIDAFPFKGLPNPNIVE